MIFNPKSWLLILFGAAVYAYLSKPRIYPMNLDQGYGVADQMRLGRNNPSPVK